MNQVIKGQFSREGWKTVRAAMANWGKTARFAVIVLVMTIPPLLLALWIRGQF